MDGRVHRTIRVENLPDEILDREILDLFYKYGHIVHIKVSLSSSYRCSALVEFKHSCDAEDAISGRDGYKFDGFRLRVRLAYWDEAFQSSMSMLTTLACRLEEQSSCHEEDQRRSMSHESCSGAVDDGDEASDMGLYVEIEEGNSVDSVKGMEETPDVVHAILEEDVEAVAISHLDGELTDGVQMVETIGCIAKPSSGCACKLVDSGTNFEEVKLEHVLTEGYTCGVVVHNFYDPFWTFVEESGCQELRILGEQVLLFGLQSMMHLLFQEHFPHIWLGKVNLEFKSWADKIRQLQFFAVLNDMSLHSFWIIGKVVVMVHLCGGLSYLDNNGRDILIWDPGGVLLAVGGGAWEQL